MQQLVTFALEVETHHGPEATLDSLTEHSSASVNFFRPFVAGMNILDVRWWLAGSYTYDDDSPGQVECVSSRAAESNRRRKEMKEEKNEFFWTLGEEKKERTEIEKAAGWRRRARRSLHVEHSRLDSTRLFVLLLHLAFFSLLTMCYCVIYNLIK